MNDLSTRRDGKPRLSCAEILAANTLLIRQGNELWRCGEAVPNYSLELVQISFLGLQ